MGLSRSDLESLLLTVDEEIAEELGVPSTPYEVILVGGSALILSGITNRAETSDIDVVEYDSAIRNFLARHPEINSAAFCYECNLPDGFLDRLVELPLDTAAVKFCTPSREDLAVMKLYGFRKQDIEDLSSKEFVVGLDWEVLESFVMDERGADINCVSPRAYREMVDMYRNYEEWNRTGGSGA